MLFCSINGSANAPNFFFFSFLWIAELEYEITQCLTMIKFAGTGGNQYNCIIWACEMLQFLASLDT